MGTLRSTQNLGGHDVNGIRLGVPIRLTIDLDFVTYDVTGLPVTDPHWYAWDDAALPTGVLEHQAGRLIITPDIDETIL